MPVTGALHAVLLQPHVPRAALGAITSGDLLDGYPAQTPTRSPWHQAYVEGAIVAEENFATTREEFAAYFSAIPQVRMVIEVGTHSVCLVSCWRRTVTKW